MIANAQRVREYIAARVEQGPHGCLVWMGSRTAGGYGTAKVAGYATTAHRLAWMLENGSIADGLEVDHVRALGCTTTLCVSVAHLELVSHLENVRRSSVAGRTHCKRCHEFTPENTYIKANGCRACRRCNAMRGRLLRAANPERYRAYDRNRTRAKGASR